MSFDRLNGGTVIDGTFEAGADTFFEKVRKNLESALFHPASLVGGSKTSAFMGTGWLAVRDALPIVVPETESAGGIYRVTVALKCANGATSVTPRLRNITDDDGTGDVTGTLTTSTAWVLQTLALSPIVAKVYELQAVKGDDLHPVWIMGWVTRRVI